MIAPSITHVQEMRGTVMASAWDLKIRRSTNAIVGREVGRAECLYSQLRECEEGIYEQKFRELMDIMKGVGGRLVAYEILSDEEDALERQKLITAFQAYWQQSNERHVTWLFR